MTNLWGVSRMHIELLTFKYLKDEYFKKNLF